MTVVEIPQAPPQTFMSGLVAIHTEDSGSGWFLPCRLAQLAQAGDDIPLSVAAQALIDTSSAFSYVSRSEAERLGLIAGAARVSGAGLGGASYPAFMLLESANGGTWDLRPTLIEWSGGPAPLGIGRDLIATFHGIHIYANRLMIAFESVNIRRRY